MNTRIHEYANSWIQKSHDRVRSGGFFVCGGVPVSTWALTVKEHAGAPEVLVKTGKL